MFRGRCVPQVITGAGVMRQASSRTPLSQGLQRTVRRLSFDRQVDFGTITGRNEEGLDDGRKSQQPREKRNNSGAGKGKLRARRERRPSVIDPEEVKRSHEASRSIPLPTFKV